MKKVPVHSYKCVNGMKTSTRLTTHLDSVKWIVRVHVDEARVAAEGPTHTIQATVRTWILHTRAQTNMTHPVAKLHPPFEPHDFLKLGIAFCAPYPE